MDASCDREVNDGEVVLQSECRECHGDGEIATYDGPEPCPNCGGSGYQKTKLGRRVLELMRTHFAFLMRELADGKLS
jgi:DnaJ-class molecular chaperone